MTSQTRYFILIRPYWGFEDYYGKNIFDRDQFIEMSRCLGGLKGRFILSINDVPGVRQAFSSFLFEEVSLRYSIKGGRGVNAKELIISGPEFENSGETSPTK
jgi:DNA adenine methylase